MPTGKVKFYDGERGFGFLRRDDDGDDVYVASSALPGGVSTLKAGTRVEFGVAQGRRGDQALQVRLLDPLPSLSAAARRPAEELHGLVDDMIKLLEAKIQPTLRRGRYPDKRDGERTAELLRAVARELEG